MVPAEETVTVIKRLVRHGNSYALVIDRPILNLLKIKEDTPLALFTDGKDLVVVPESIGKTRETVMAAYRKVSRKHRALLKRLSRID